MGLVAYHPSGKVCCADQLVLALTAKSGGKPSCLDGHLRSHLTILTPSFPTRAILSCILPSHAYTSPILHSSDLPIYLVTSWTVQSHCGLYLMRLYRLTIVP